MTRVFYNPSRALGATPKASDKKIKLQKERYTPVHSSQIHKWKSQVLDGIPEIFSSKAAKKEKSEKELIDELYKQIGQLKVENDWLKKKLELIN